MLGLLRQKFSSKALVLRQLFKKEMCRIELAHPVQYLANVRYVPAHTPEYFQSLEDQLIAGWPNTVTSENETSFWWVKNLH